MANIKVHVLNFHSIWSHLEVVLENTSIEPHAFYRINRWARPLSNWRQRGPNQLINIAGSVFSFEIEADPNQITRKWRDYWYDTLGEVGILSKNCAVAVQWFLTEFAGVPKPSMSNLSWNHLAFGIMWPSFISCPATLSGRVMSNAKFHINARMKPEQAEKYSRLFLYTSMAMASLVFVASMFALAVAATVLTGGLAGVAIGACAVVGLASTSGFFSAYNKLSAKNIISNELRESDEGMIVNSDLLSSTSG